MARKKKEIPDKHAVPVLENDTDFYSLFNAHSKSDRLPFAKVIDDSLTADAVDQALQEKRMGMALQVQPQHAKQYPPPQAKLDLHGFTAVEAESKTDIFIQGAVQRGLSTLCIVTGKVLHSEGEGVLREVIENRLLVMKQDNIIASFCWEKKTKQKSGAVIVYLP